MLRKVTHPHIEIWPHHLQSNKYNTKRSNKYCFHISYHGLLLMSVLALRIFCSIHVEVLLVLVNLKCIEGWQHAQSPFGDRTGSTRVSGTVGCSQLWGPITPCSAARATEASILTVDDRGNGPGAVRMAEVVFGGRGIRGDL